MRASGWNHLDAESEGLTFWAPKRALLAEDDDDMRRMLVRWLQKEDFEVIEARDGDELLGLLRAFGRSSPDEIAVDLVVSDVRMPGLDGLEVLERLRREDSMMPVILISAFADQTVFAEAVRLGATLIDKPFGLDRLRVALCELGLSDPPPASVPPMASSPGAWS